MMRSLSIAAAILCCAQSAASAEYATRDVEFYSEAVLCSGKLFVPKQATEANKVAAVVLAPAAGETQTKVEAQAASLASNGLIAMTLDYRGWGRSGGFLYFGDAVRFDDRMRFTPITSPMIIRRKRIDPKAQAIDIRNAMTFLQGEPNVDRTRLAVWGVGLSADHAIVVAASDARVKAFVAQQPTLLGKDAPIQAFTPSKEQQAAMIELARNGKPPTSETAAVAMNAKEEKLALAEYFPVWALDSMPQATAGLIVGKIGDSTVAAAAKRSKGPIEVVADIESAVSWLAKRLQ